ncbi:hypothetical protein [Jeotgalibaca porci]|uniref:hypothetical protein n=1 Tax=Jeotgalibaca porci TaxID=1868793 RepID=UPI0035A05805
MKDNIFYEAIILSLAFSIVMLIGIAFEKDREHHLELYAKDQQIFELQRKIDEAEDLYGKATYHIEIMNKEREAE